MSQTDNGNPNRKPEESGDLSDVVIRAEELPPGPPWPRLGRPLPCPSKEELEAYLRNPGAFDIVVTVDEAGNTTVWPPQPETPPPPGPPTTSS